MELVDGCGQRLNLVEGNTAVEHGLAVADHLVELELRQLQGAGGEQKQSALLRARVVLRVILFSCFSYLRGPAVTVTEASPRRFCQR